MKLSFSQPHSSPTQTHCWFGDLDDTELLKLRAFLQEMHAEAGEDVRDFLRRKFEWIS